MTARRRRGFTFVELLIASTMIALLIVGLSRYLQGGFTVWERATQAMDTVQRREVALDYLARDFANAFLFDDRDEAVVKPTWGTGGSQWVTAVLKPGEVDVSGAQMRVVTYGCGESTGSASEAAGFWRSEQTLGEFLAGIAAPPHLLLEGCEQLSWRYAYRSTDGSAPVVWSEQWGLAARMPRLVELTLHAGAQGVVRHVLFNPAGELPSVEETESPS